MPGFSLNRVVINVVTSDLGDSVSRVLADVQRFGWALNEIAASASSADTAEFKLAVSAPSDIQLAHIEDRLARHPTVATVQARWASG